MVSKAVLGYTATLRLATLATQICFKDNTTKYLGMLLLHNYNSRKIRQHGGEFRANLLCSVFKFALLLIAIISVHVCVPICIMCVNAQVLQCTCGGQRTALWEMILSFL